MRNIVVVGAGYTGLVTALRLSEAGHKVTILERNSSIGGLASDFTINGTSLERAYHHIFKTDESIISLAKELGLGNKIEWHSSSISIYYGGQLFPFKGAKDLLLFKPLPFHDRLRAGLVVLYLQKTKNWKKFENITAYDWMLKASGKKVTKVIWEPLLMGKFDTYYDKVSMAWLWARIHVRAQSREVGGEKLGYFNGGFQAFTDALLSKLKEQKVEIKTNFEIKSIVAKNNKVLVKHSDDKVNKYDCCVATTPSKTFAKLVSTDQAASKSYLSKLEGINYLGARIMIFTSTQNISPYYWHNINDTQLPFLVFINHTNLIDKKAYNGEYVYYVATYLPHNHKLFTCSDTELQKLWHSGIKQVFPSFEANKITNSYFFTFPNAQHIVTNNYSKLLPSYKTPLKNVYLANFSQIYPEDRGTNYAVKEGEKIAQLVLRSI